MWCGGLFPQQQPAADREVCLPGLAWACAGYYKDPYVELNDPKDQGIAGLQDAPLYHIARFRGARSRAELVPAAGKAAAR